MEVTQVSMTVDGEQMSGVQTWLLDGTVGEGPQRLFRQVLYLRFVLDGYADGILISPEQTRLCGRFLAYEYDAQHVSTPALAAQLSNGDNGVLVQLDAPRQLRTVRLHNALALGASSKVTVHRVDGNQVVEEATAEAGWNSVFATAADLAKIQANRTLPLRAVTSGTTAMTNSQTPKLIQGSNVAAFATDFTDMRFGLRLHNSPTTLTVSHLAGLTVRSYPSAPRLGLAAPDALTTPRFFLRLTGEIGKADDGNAGQVNAGVLLAGALQQAVDAFFAQLLDTATPNPPLLPHQFDVALVLESDAPCQFQIDEFVVGYELVRRNFPDYAEKQLLRFAGTAVETQRISLPLPKAATVTQATLTVVAKLGTTGFAEQVAPALPSDTLHQATGIHLGLERWAAQPLTPPQALTASGVIVGLLTLTPKTEVTLELYEDWQGQPAGKKLTTVTLPVAQSGQRRWLTVDFPEPLLLFAQPYWLLLKAVRGAALWLAQAGTPAVQMVTQENHRWQTVAVIANTQGLMHFLSPVAADQQAVPLAVSVDGRPVTTAPVTIGDRQTYDLTAALCAALPTTVPGRIDRALVFTTGLAGVLTVYSPMISYSI